jgi:hypothetical protein
MKFKAVLLFFLLTTIPALAQEMVAPTFERCQHIEVGEEMQVCFNRTLMEHVMTTLKYPEGLEEEGKVFIKITFDEEGQLQEPEVLKSFSELASDEASQGDALFATDSASCHRKWRAREYHLYHTCTIQEITLKNTFVLMVVLAILALQLFLTHEE